MNRSIRPGQTMYDTDGKRIHAHGGGIINKDGIYYWYGENKEKTIKGSEIWHWGVRCYKSTDLYNWEDMGIIIPPDLSDEASPLHPKSMMDRPHILYNDKTNQYVCWLKIMGKNNIQTITMLTSEYLWGPYRLIKTNYRPFGMNAGDFDLAKDEETGKAYYFFQKIHTHIVIAELCDDYLGVQDAYTLQFERDFPPEAREAPAYFTAKGKHYLITSGTTWYKPNPSEVGVSDTHMGPYRELGNLHPKDDSHTSYGSQISEVFKVQGKNLYITIGDRWIPGLRIEKGAGDRYIKVYSRALRLFSKITSKKFIQEMLAKEKKPKRKKLNNGNTAIADYVWLPIQFEGEKPIIRWYDEWRVEDFD